MQSDGECSCPLCKHDGVEIQRKYGRDTFDVECPRCGRYSITSQAMKGARDYGHDTLAPVVVAARRASDSGTPLQILEEDFETLSRRQPLSAGRKARLLLEFVANQSKQIGDVCTLRPYVDWPAIEASSSNELSVLIDYLIKRGWASEPRPMLSPDRSVVLTIEGWAEFERPGEDGIIRNRVFVAMSFNPEHQGAYLHGIRPGIEECGCEPRYLNDRENPDMLHTENINNRILAEIALAEFVVADVTHHSKGVYFEAGYAMALGRPVLFTCRTDQQDDCHFDTKHYPHHFWPPDNFESLRDGLAAWLGALIGRRPPV